MCRCLVKFILFFFNLIFVLIGLLVIGAGVFVIYQLKSLTEISENLQVNVDFIPYVIIGLGVAVFLIAFSGCCGSITETKCLLVTYAVCMALLAAVKIVITVLLFVKLTDLTNTVETAVNNLFYSDDIYQNATFHVIEAQFQCCGITGPDDYVNDYNLTSPTCCKSDGNTTFPIDDLPLGNLTTKDQHRENLPIDISNLPGNISIDDLPGNIDLGNLTVCKKEDAYQTGCTALIGGAVRLYGRSFGIVLIIAIGIELFAMSFSIYLIRTMKRKPKIVHEQPRYYY